MILDDPLPSALRTLQQRRRCDIGTFLSSSLTLFPSFSSFSLSFSLAPVLAFPPYSDSHFFYLYFSLLLSPSLYLSRTFARPHLGNVPTTRSNSYRLRTEIKVKKVGGFPLMKRGASYREATDVKTSVAQNISVRGFLSRLVARNRSLAICAHAVACECGSLYAQLT